MTVPEKLYLVKYSQGSWDDYYEVTLWATPKLDVAQAWVEKFNLRVGHWKEVMKEYEDEDGYLAEEHWGLGVARRYHTIVSINRAWHEEISIRYLH